jgi:hypothetical protein
MACCIVLVWWALAYGLDEGIPTELKNEAQVYLLLPMALLSFPAGVLWAVLLAGALKLAFDAGLAVALSPMFHAVLAWAGFVVVGYVQWFVLLPSLIGRRSKQPR